jgi:hypothetical protein
VKKKSSLSVLLTASAVFVCVTFSVATGLAGSQEAGMHPELTEQPKLMPCSECHKSETPEIYKQWYDSRHGIGMVKCYQCHGTFENLVTVPEVSTCGFCHTDMLEKCPSDKTCWQCHASHSFEIQK